MSWHLPGLVGRPGWLMAGLVVAYGLGSMLWGERLPKCDGFGWDGNAYRYLTEHPGETVDWISAYTGRRCLPSFVVRLTMEALQLPLDGPHILETFAAVNLAQFLIALVAMLGCCREAKVGPAGQWLMFVAFFVTYAHLKQYHYAVAQTDVWATALSALMLWAYLARRPAALLVLAAAGAFVWPVLMHVGSVLFLFPRRDGETDHEPLPRARWWAAAGIGLAAVVTTAHLVHVRHAPPVQPDQVIRSWLPVSIGLVGVFLTAAFGPLLGGRTMTDVRQYLARGWPVRLVLLIGLWAAVEFTQARLDGLYLKRSPFQGGTWGFLKTIVLFAASKPWAFLVAHLAWFGPVAALGAWYWPGVCREARRFGPGLVLILAAGVVMALSAESRQSLTFLPAFVLLTACVADRQGWGAGRVAAFAVLALAASRVWLPLNVAPWPEPGQKYAYPMQRFFMSCGYMTNRSFLLLGSAGLVTAITVVGIASLRRPRPAVG